MTTKKEPTWVTPWMRHISFGTRMISFNINYDNILKLVLTLVFAIGVWFTTFNPWLLLAGYLLSVFHIQCTSFIVHNVICHGFPYPKNRVFNSVMALGILLYSSFETKISYLAGYVHRGHHGKSDTENDPHRHFMNLSLPRTSTYARLTIRDIRKIKELPVLGFAYKYLWWMRLAFPIILLCIGWEYFLYLFCMPLFFNSLVAYTTLVAMHTDKFPLNYQSHVLNNGRDKSQNCPLSFWFMLGAAWHNNHHKYPSKMTDYKKKNWWEIEPLTWILKLLGEKTQ